MEDLRDEFINYLIEVASGKETNNEKDFREIALLKMVWFIEKYETNNRWFHVTQWIRKTLFHKCKDEPIFDFHCHLEAKEIYENKNFDSKHKYGWWRPLQVESYESYGVSEEKLLEIQVTSKIWAWAKEILH